MNIRIPAALFLLCFICFPLFSQDAGAPEDVPHSASETEAETAMSASETETVIALPENNYQPDAVFVIDSFNFDITGMTRPEALMRKGDLKKGEEITGLPGLEMFIQNKTQLLYNERVLESVSIHYTIGDKREDDKYPVNLIITTTDTWNIVAIPRPQYSSNSGFDITIKARDYNFLGTMSPLRLDLGYQYDESGQTFFNFMLDSDVPFTMFNLNWNINFDNYFDYRPNMERPYFYRNVSGISVEVPVGPTKITTGFDESFIYNEENPDRYKEAYGDFQDGLYLSSKPYISWKIPTGLVMGYWGDLVYTPGIFAVFNHEISRWPLDDIHKGPFLNFTHSLGFSRVDWIKNFLKGFDVGIRHSIDYNFFKSRNDKQPWEVYLEISGTGHFTDADIFGVSSRLMYRHWFFNEIGSDNRAANVLRGILDKNISADYMISTNIDITMKILSFRPSDWLEKPKMRIFDFDLHLVPFLDAALFRSPEIEARYGGADFTYKNILVTSGMEAIIFPGFFRSLFLRVSLGINLSTLIDLSKYELFIGTDLHY